MKATCLDCGSNNMGITDLTPEPIKTKRLNVALDALFSFAHAHGIYPHWHAVYGVGARHGDDWSALAREFQTRAYKSFLSVEEVEKANTIAEEVYAATKEAKGI